MESTTAEGLIVINSNHIPNNISMPHICTRRVYTEDFNYSNAYYDVIAKQIKADEDYIQIAPEYVDIIAALMTSTTQFVMFTNRFIFYARLRIWIYHDHGELVSYPLVRREHYSHFVKDRELRVITSIFNILVHQNRNVILIHSLRQRANEAAPTYVLTFDSRLEIVYVVMGFHTIALLLHQSGTDVIYYCHTHVLYSDRVKWQKMCGDPTHFHITENGLIRLNVRNTGACNLIAVDPYTDPLAHYAINQYWRSIKK